MLEERKETLNGFLNNVLKEYYHKSEDGLFILDCGINFSNPETASGIAEAFSTEDPEGSVHSVLEKKEEKALDEVAEKVKEGWYTEFSDKPSEDDFDYISFWVGKNTIFKHSHDMMAFMESEGL